jgi:hypothetical protein
MNKKLFMTMAAKKECANLCGNRGGCTNPEEADHTCPFSEEINNDSESLCNCCSDCRRECAEDI